jgi:hypothetical protein
LRIVQHALPTEAFLSRAKAVTGGGSALAWSRDGKQIYYRSTDEPLMAADVVIEWK